MPEGERPRESLKDVLGLEIYNHLQLEVAKLALGEKFADPGARLDWINTTWGDFREVAERHREEIIKVFVLKNEENGLIAKLTEEIKKSAEETKNSSPNPEMLQ